MTTKKVSKCRIGKVKLKNGGEIELLNLPPKKHVHQAIEFMSQVITDQSQCAAFFVIDKDGHCHTGLAYEGGTYLAQMYGGCDILAEAIQEHWHVPEPEYDEDA